MSKPMPKSRTRHMLEPQGQFPKAGLMRRLAAMFYDFMLCVALVMVMTWIYQQGILRLIYGGETLRQMADQGVLDRDPLLASLLLISLFVFFAKFWTHNGQTLGMQAWGVRVQNADGSRITLLQALMRFLVSIASLLPAGLGFWWMLVSKDKNTWHDSYSQSYCVQLPKNVHKK